MSLAKARDLMRLAEMAAARHQGVSLAEIAETFDADHRTAQRMARALEDTFPDVEIRTDEDRRRRWKLRDPGLARFQGVRDDELAALEMSIRRAEREGASPDVAALAALRDRLLACMPGPHARRAEADAEALLEAQGFAARPGPAVRAEPGVLETIAEALKGPFLLAITYAGAGGVASPSAAWRRTACCSACAATLSRATRTATPRCATSASTASAPRACSGRASYASPASTSPPTPPAPSAPTRTRRATARSSGASRPPRRATAREFVFHPGQRFEAQPDGSLVVRFHASGWLEMAWHLYQWGDAVEVLAPDGLRALVENHRRSDFEALP